MIYLSVNALEIKTFMFFKLVLAKNTVLSCFFLYFLIIDLCSLIPAVFVQVFNHAAELEISIGMPYKEAKTEMEIHPVTSESKIRKCSV